MSVKACFGKEETSHFVFPVCLTEENVTLVNIVSVCNCYQGIREENGG